MKNVGADHKISVSYTETAWALAKRAFVATAALVTLLSPFHTSEALASENGNMGLSQAQLSPSQNSENKYTLCFGIETLPGQISKDAGQVFLFFNSANDARGYSVVYVPNNGAATVLKLDSSKDLPPAVVTRAGPKVVLANPAWMNVVGLNGEKINIHADRNGSTINGQEAGNVIRGPKGEGERKALELLERGGPAKSQPAKPQKEMDNAQIYEHNLAELNELIRFARNNGVGAGLDKDDAGGFKRALLAKIGVSKVDGQISMSVSGKANGKMFFDFSSDVAAANSLVSAVKGAKNEEAYTNSKGETFAASVSLKISDLQTAVMVASLKDPSIPVDTNYTNKNPYNRNLNP